MGGNGGMMSPFGSISGGFFGGGAGGGAFGEDPWNKPPRVGGGGGGGGERGGNGSGGSGGGGGGGRGWMKSSLRSVTSSSPVDRDKVRKHVVTTVMKTTVVDSNGKGRMETVTTRRHVDDGGRVDTEKVASNGREQTPWTAGAPPTAGGSNGRGDGSAVDGLTAKTAATTASRCPHDHCCSMFLPTFPFHHPATGLGWWWWRRRRRPPPKVATIATDCLLGVSISNAASTDLDGSSSKVGGGKRIR
jgi:hypothetical protein